ncbi:MAG TPA: UDP-3-O-(3-hydroxymyristoyl)glucosamine N-acyltransferase [Candidatus Sulfomarinibacteraceae bacterium]|nr:UDP-3-O-(3-hydroxymyristoyl)glucosamine N-acyltransferase [Candidatus Sulfomarinibacteraceae bacterium]
MTGAWKLAELAARLGAELVGDGDRELVGIQPLDAAGPEHLSFLHNPKYAAQAAASRAGAVIVDRADRLPGRDLLVTGEPYLAVARALQLLHPRPRPEPGVHPSAVVAHDAELGAGVSIGPHSVVGGRAVVGPRTIIAAGCVIGEGVRIGGDCHLHPRVVVEDGCRIGHRCILQAGVVIGSDGYGFATVGGVHHKVPQVGIVVLEDDVEIQANTTVDRATMGETRIGRGTKIDNLVQLAHNVRVGEHCLLVAQVGISGSTRLGDHCVLAGKVGVAGHLEIGDRTMVGATAGVMKSVPSDSVLAGFPARPQREWLKTQAAVGRIDSLRHRVAELERRLAALEGPGEGQDGS